MMDAFDRCVQRGGSVKTITGPSKQFGLSQHEYVRICYLKGSGQPVRGPVRIKVLANALRGQLQDNGKQK